MKRLQEVHRNEGLHINAPRQPVWHNSVQIKLIFSKSTYSSKGIYYSVISPLAKYSFDSSRSRMALLSAKTMLHSISKLLLLLIIFICNLMLSGLGKTTYTFLKKLLLRLLTPLPSDLAYPKGHTPQSHASFKFR